MRPCRSAAPGRCCAPAGRCLAWAPTQSVRQCEKGSRHARSPPLLLHKRCSGLLPPRLCMIHRLHGMTAVRGTECLKHLYLACAPDPHPVSSLYWNLLARSAAPGRGTARLAGAPSPPSPPCLVPKAQGTARQLKAAPSWPLSGLGKPCTHALSPQSLHSANCVWRVTMPPCSPTAHRAGPALRTVFALPAATHRLQPLTPPPSCHPPARATGCLPSLPSTGCSLGSVPAPATPPGALPRLGICHVDPRNSFQPCVL